MAFISLHETVLIPWWEIIQASPDSPGKAQVTPCSQNLVRVETATGSGARGPRRVPRACSVAAQPCASLALRRRWRLGVLEPGSPQRPRGLRVGARGRAAVGPALHQGRTGASGPSRRRPFSGRRCGRTRRSGSAMDPAGSARAAERSPVSALGPARLRGVGVGRREPVGSARAGLQWTRSRACGAASVRRCPRPAPPGSAAGGQRAVTLRTWGSGLSNLPSPEAQTGLLPDPTGSR